MHAGGASSRAASLASVMFLSIVMFEFTLSLDDENRRFKAHLNRCIRCCQLVCHGLPIIKPCGEAPAPVEIFLSASDAKNRDGDDRIIAAAIRSYA
jgi:hypothetical protein